MREAWHALREDRFYGAMGGIGSIYYTARSQYYRDHGIPIWPFDLFVMAMDGEFVTISNEKALAANKQA